MKPKSFYVGHHGRKEYKDPHHPGSGRGHINMLVLDML